MPGVKPGSELNYRKRERERETERERERERDRERAREKFITLLQVEYVE